MVLDPIPQSLPVHFFGSRPQPPTSPLWISDLKHKWEPQTRRHTRLINEKKTHFMTFLIDTTPPEDTTAFSMSVLNLRNVWSSPRYEGGPSVLQCVAVCCSVLQCVARFSVCCSDERFGPQKRFEPQKCMIFSKVRNRTFVKTHQTQEWETNESWTRRQSQTKRHIH